MVGGRWYFSLIFPKNLKKQKGLTFQDFSFPSFFLVQVHLKDANNIEPPVPRKWRPIEAASGYRTQKFPNG